MALTDKQRSRARAQRRLQGWIEDRRFARTARVALDNAQRVGARTRMSLVPDATGYRFRVTW